MASPQTEDGFVRIANELFDAIVRFGFSKRQLTVLLAVVRKTYGYGKKTDDMTVQQLANLTKIPRQHVSATISELVAMRAVLKQDGQHGYILGINKNHGAWAQLEPARSPVLKRDTPVPNQDTSQNRTVSVLKQDGERPETGHTIDNPNRQPQKTDPPIGPPTKSRTTPTTHPDRNAGSHRMTWPNDYPLGFQELRKAYPRRLGGCPNPRALSAYRALQRADPTWTDERLLAQVEAYARQCGERGIVGTEYVMQLASWLGPEKQGYAQDWSQRGTPHAERQRTGSIPPGTGTGPRGTRVIADIVRDADAAAALAAARDGQAGHGAAVAPDERDLWPAALAGARSRGSDR